MPSALRWNQCGDTCDRHFGDESLGLKVGGLADQLDLDRYFDMADVNTIDLFSFHKHAGFDGGSVMFIRLDLTRSR